MAKISVFNFTTLNGFYKTTNGSIDWHQHGGEESEYSAQSLSADNILLFGRTTYDMMASFWPTPMAMEMDAATANGMNKAEKIVFSKTLRNAEWNNTKIIRENIVEEMKKLKKTSSKDFTILGSGSIVTQFAEVGLIDQYQIMIDPVVLGAGVPMFNGMKKELHLSLINSRVFKSGVVLLTYSL